MKALDSSPVLRKHGVILPNVSFMCSDVSLQSHILTSTLFPYQIPSTFSRFSRILSLSELLQWSRLPSLLPAISPLFELCIHCDLLSVSWPFWIGILYVSSAAIINEIEICLILKHGHLDSLSSRICCDLCSHHSFRFSLWISAQLFTKLMLHKQSAVKSLYECRWVRKLWKYVFWTCLNIFNILFFG